jgi:hypothetical protein
MYGFQDLASQQQQRFWVYTGNKVSNGYQTWLKPPGINFVHIFCIGGGGGGSSGLGSGGAVGGSGGGSGGMTNVFLPSFLVPDTLFINVGLGGAGGASTTSSTTRNNGTAGTITYVSYHPTQGAGYSLCFANNGNGGSATGGSGGGAASSTNMPISQVGLRTYQAGQNGIGGTGGSGTSNLTAIYRITGGIGAWGAGGAGPTLGPPGDYGPITYAPSDATQPGGGGINDLIKFIFTTGLPARSSTVASAQNSGNSGYGCGGPGGAGGNPNSGAGGRGGDGLVIITCG